jgi:hypothetical protein
MLKAWSSWLLGLAAVVVLALGCLWAVPAQAGALAQQPTLSIPTVTGSPSGPFGVVNPDQNIVDVWAGPGVEYGRIGILVTGERVPVLGRNADGTWVQIAYPGVDGGVGWVYTYFLTVRGQPPTVKTPLVPTPNVTPTMDPTIAARYPLVVELTRPATFTPPPPLAIATYAPDDPNSNKTPVPLGFLIIGMGVVGLFGMIISILRGR